MLFKSLSRVAVTPATNQNQPLRFGWNQAVDIGTSQGINAKIQVYDDAWNPLSAISPPQRMTYPSFPTTPLNNDEQLKFSAGNNKNALEVLITAMAQNLKQVVSKIDEQINLGKNLIFFVPGQVQDNVVSRMGAGSETLHQFDLKPLPDLLRQKLKGLSKLHAHQEPHLIVLNDMAGGTAASMAQLAQKHPEKFKPGLDATYLMSGGGLGMAGVSYVADQHATPQIKIDLMELGCLPTPKLEPNGQISRPMSPLLASRLEDFTDALPARYAPQKASVIGSCNTEIITNYDKARTFLPGLSKAEFLRAACKSTRDYQDVLGGYLRYRIATGSNLAILGGKTAAGYRDFINAHPTQFAAEVGEYDQHFQRPDDHHKSVFDKVFLVRVRRQLPEKLQELFDMRQFDVVSDVNIDSNTEGAPYIAQGWFQNRSDRFAIPTHAFQYS